MVGPTRRDRSRLRILSKRLKDMADCEGAQHSEAVPVFEGTEIVITTVGKRHLGAAIGTCSFIEKYAEQKIAAWIHEVETISSLATTQPHAAYAAFTRGLDNKWTFLARTIDPRYQQAFGAARRENPNNISPRTDRPGHVQW